MTEKSLIMVLGMHRSGTSAITKGLETLGVSLSENVLPQSNENAKGYWEDLDILAINEKLLHYAGLEWFSPTPFPVDKLDEPFCKALIDEAALLLCQKISENELWGFKEPRSSRLLPFWLATFKQAEITPKFVFAIRNPLDVALSLEKRDKFKHLHSYYLWLLHVVPNLELVTKFDYALIDFSSLLKNPEKSIQLMAKKLKLTVNDNRLSEFSEDHLDSSLCHSSSKLNELAMSRDANSLLVRAYETLLNASLDAEGLHELNVKDEFFELVKEFNNSQASLLSNLNLPEYEEYWKLLDLNKKYWDLLHEKNLLANSYNALTSNCGKKIKKPERECNNKIEKLEVGHQKHIEALETTHQLEINTFEEKLNISNARLEQVHQSTSWKVTMPLRLFTRIVRGDWHEIRLGVSHRIPLIDRAFNPIAGGFLARLGRLTSLLLTKGPKAVVKKIQTINNNTEFLSENLSSYRSWLKYRGPQEKIDDETVIKSLSKMQRPLISVVIPTYNTEEKYLRLCLDSVLSQSYQNWELCIADDASTALEVSKVLKEYEAKDKRIKVTFRKENGHISAATNSALELVTGEWVALLDHDDELHIHALSYVANALNKSPSAQFIYSDEDKIDQQGRRSDPHFKPDWNLDLLYSQNYISHLGVYQAEIIKNIGGFRIGYEGSQDYDLLLRYSREIDHKNIVHIPKVLYHWRMLEGSTALASGEKSYTTEVGIKALQDHFNALNENVIVEKGMHANIYKANWQLEDEPLISLIIPTYNGYDITKQAIDSILDKTTYSNYEIILVDNNSDDEVALTYFEYIDKQDRVTVIRYPYPFNYSAINNFAVKQAKGDIIGLINNDIEVINPEWLTEMVSHAHRDDVGCVGAMLYYPNDTIQHAGVVIGIAGVAGHSHKHFHKSEFGYFSRLKVVQNYSAVTAACLLVRKSVFNQVGGLNEIDLSVAFNDIDFCLKVQAAGYRNLWTPYAKLYHHESISRGAEDNPEKIARFNKEVDFMKSTWKTDKVSDFAYNPNLTKDHENFHLVN
ncbi:glycosyltransferase [Vibrio cyclitrophicus]